MKIFQKQQNFTFLALILSIAFFLLSYMFSLYDKTNKNNSYVTESLNLKLKILESKSDTYVREIINDHKNEREINYFKKESLIEHSEKEGITIFIYNKDSLIFWNSNSVEIPLPTVKSIAQNKFLHLGNGWYECRKKTFGNNSVVVLILIKNQYDYQNEYLSNSFNRFFNISDNIDLSRDRDIYNIYSGNGEFLFSLNFNTLREEYGNYINIIVTCNISGIIFLLISVLYFNSKYLQKRTKYGLAGVIIFLTALRIITFIFRIPHAIYTLEIFSPMYYAGSSLLPSLGDMFLNSILILLISILVYKHYYFYQTTSNKAKRNYFLLLETGSVFLLFSFCYGFIYLFRSLILNSDIAFSFTNIFNLTFNSYVGLTIIAALIFSYFLVSLILIKKVLISLLPKKFLIILTVNILVFAGISLLIKISLLNIFIPFISVITLWYLLKYFPGNRDINFRTTIIFLLIFTGSITFMLNRYNNYKENSRRILLASRLSEERDFTAEYLFSSVQEGIQNDKYILENIKNVSDDKIELTLKKYILKKYFSDYWLRYNVQITICESTDSLLVKPDNINTNCKDFFMNMITLTCKSTLTKGLYYRANESATNSYIAYFNFPSDKLLRKEGTDMIIEIDSKFIPKELGFPKLLIDKRLDIANDFSNYSYAKYKNGELIYQYGKYFFRSNLEDLKKEKKDYYFIYKNKYNHLVYNSDSSTVYIISRENDSLIRLISPFSYLIIFFGIFFILLILYINYPLVISLKALSLQSRIVYSTVFIIIISILGIGTLTVWNINKSNEVKNRDNLSEKTHSVLVEAENKLSGEEKILPAMYDNISGMLQNLSNIFFTDINVYNERGRLISSSRPRIYEEGLQSENMNPVACRRMLFDSKTLIIQKENIGNLDYFSSYMPVRNIHNKTIAYVNLPYFAKQSEYKNEISTFLTTFINIYVIIAAISVMLVLLISNYITSPLRLIKEKISSFRLGIKNEKIEWTRNDELGKLISEYNKMIDELEKSAEMLAKSERESAWREMAKQVAHEIKNPLTPMKLSVQYLLKMYREDNKSDKEKLEKMTATLIEQIDMLSDIATEFSDFAKMPLTNNEKVDLKKVILNSVELYKQAGNLKINIFFDRNEAFVYADYKQLLRVFNNILRNSEQAIESNSEGIIDIDIITEEENYLIKISDNGIGINHEDAAKIFSPNFTTKTGGTGLGLPLAKNIIESSGGKIWFDSESNKGTTFFISMPVYNTKPLAK